jgi:hypothetical protein
VFVYTRRYGLSVTAATLHASQGRPHPALHPFRGYRVVVAAAWPPIASMRPRPRQHRTGSTTSTPTTINVMNTAACVPVSASRDSKIVGYRAIADAGGDPATIADWIAEVTAQRDAASPGAPPGVPKHTRSSGSTTPTLSD